MGVVLVEGPSDEIALEAVARVRGVDLAAAGIAIVPIGGAHAVGRFAGRFPGARLCALCDAGERQVFLRAGIDDRALFVCERDLEEEVIRAVGAARVAACVSELGDGEPLRTFRKQPAWRERPLADQLHRFFNSSDRRKFRYLPVLLAGLPPGRVPAPLAGVLDYASGESPGVTTPAS
jgi:hypothetical protein